MTTTAARPVEACLIDLFQHLGLGAARIRSLFATARKMGRAGVRID